ncbi:unnamed protein product [Prunus armeniaca]
MEDELRATVENFKLMEEEKNKLEQKLREEEEEIKILKKQNLGMGQQVVVLEGEILSYRQRQSVEMAGNGHNVVYTLEQLLMAWA